MDSKEIKTIEEQIKKTVDNITVLEEEIKNYQTGYKAFSESTKALMMIVASNKAMTEKVGESVKNLEKTDTATIMKKIDDSASEIVKMKEELDMTLDRLAEVAQTITSTSKDLTAHANAIEEANKKISSEAVNRIGEMIAKAEKGAQDAEKANKKIITDSEKQISDILEKAEKSINKLVENAEKRISDASDKSIQNIEIVSAQISVQVTEVGKTMNEIKKRLDNGVEIKKKKWFA